MYSPNGLAVWEIIAASGLFALAILAVTTLIGVTLSWFALRERVPAHRPVVAPKAAEHPVAHPTGYAPATA